MFTFEAEMETSAASMADKEPKVYNVGDTTALANWIAEGTDGILYMVPAEVGDWLRRAGYKGPSEELAPVCPEKARTIVWFVYGDIGPMTIVAG